MEQVPFVSLLNFYHRFSPTGKKLFQVFFFLCLLTGCFWLFAALQGPHAGMTYTLREESYPSVHASTPPLMPEVPHTEMIAQVFSVYSLSLPGMIQPEEWSVWLLLLAYLAFWAAALTLAARMRTYWNLIPPFLFALWLAQAQTGQIIFGSDPWYLATLGICLLFYLPLYYFQHNGKDWSTLIVFVVFLGLLAALALLIAGLQGRAGLFRFQASVLPLHYLLACGALILASREPLSLVTAWLTNRKNPASRPGLPLLLITWIVLILLMCLPLAGLDESWPSWAKALFPVVLVFIALLAWPFTAQNAWHASRNAFGTNLAYTLSILAMALNAFAFFAYAAWNGDYLIILQVSRMVCFLFPLMAFLQVVYWLVNFSDLFQARQNAYFALHMPVRIRFLIVWIALSIVTVITEARKNWKTIQFMTATTLSRQGDMWLLEEQPDSALVLYEKALAIIPGDSKSNYNAGMLLLQPGKSPLPALERLQASSSSFREFTAGEVQAAAYFAFVGRNRQALDILLNTTQRSPDAEAYNMMAWLYLKLNNPDSAVLCLQNALRENPEHANACSNLGMLYFRHNRTEEARQFLALAAESAGHQPQPVTNLLFAQIAGLDSLDLTWKPEWLDHNPSQTFLSNALVWCNRNGLTDIADQVAQYMARTGESPEYLQYKLVQCLRSDSIPQALSRYKWLAKSSADQAALAAHNLGVFYLQAEVPEMALGYFNDAATWGNPVDEWLSAVVMAQTGQQDSAFKRFTAVRARHPMLQDQARKEIALLLLANGQELYAGLEWDFADAEYTDWMRGAGYAAQSGNKVWLTEMLRKAIEQDSSQWKPYYVLAQWYLAQQDTEAIQTYRDGLERMEDNPWLRTACLTAAYRLNRRDLVPDLEQSISSVDTLGKTGLEFQVEQAIAQKNFSLADTLLRNFLEDNPLDVPMLYRLGDVWQLAGADPFPASEYFFKALSFNDRNPRLWLYYSAFSSAAGLVQQAGYGALQAADLTRNEASRQEILNTFASEIQAWREAEL